MPPEQVDRLLASLPGVEAVGRRYGVLATAGGLELDTRVIDGSPSAFAFAVPDGRGVRRPGEVTLGRGALEELGVGIGDRVRLAAAGLPFTATVVGRHVEPNDDGLGVVTLAGTVPAAALRSPSWILRVADGVDPARTQAEIERLGGGGLIVSRPGESLESEVGEMRPIVYGVTALLLAIAGVNLLTTLLLSVRERRRDVAILAAVGATPPAGHRHRGRRRPAARRALGAGRPAARRLAVHDHRRHHRPGRRARRRHPAVVVERRASRCPWGWPRWRCSRPSPPARPPAWRSPPRFAPSSRREYVDKTDRQSRVWCRADARDRRAPAPLARRPAAPAGTADHSAAAAARRPRLDARAGRGSAVGVRSLRPRCCGPGRRGRARTGSSASSWLRRRRSGSRRCRRARRSRYWTPSTPACWSSARRSRLWASAARADGARRAARRRGGRPLPAGRGARGAGAAAARGAPARAARLPRCAAARAPGRRGRPRRRRPGGPR